MSTNIQKINDEVTKELANKQTFSALLATTFKGLEPDNMKQAIVEGMIRGFKFQDFLEKNVYAIPYKDKRAGTQTYSLVTSVDYARKIGMRSGVIGKSKPKYTEDKGRIITCEITIKRKVGKDIGEFTAEVYFDEYTTKMNLWTSKPRTMIAKVAEMHALRMACPEEMAQVYVEEEMQKEAAGVESKKLEGADIEIYGKKLKAAKTIEELRIAFSALPYEAKEKLAGLKDELKAKLA